MPTCPVQSHGDPKWHWITAGACSPQSCQPPLQSWGCALRGKGHSQTLLADPALSASAIFHVERSGSQLPCPSTWVREEHWLGCPISPPGAKRHQPRGRSLSRCQHVGTQLAVPGLGAAVLALPPPSWAKKFSASSTVSWLLSQLNKIYSLLKRQSLRLLFPIRPVRRFLFLALILHLDILLN